MKLKRLHIYKAINSGFLSFGIFLSQGLINSSDHWILTIELGKFHYTIALTQGTK